jgi:hypothetical protein
MSVLLPYVQGQVATALSISSDWVRVVAEDTNDWPQWAVEPLSATIWLSPPTPFELSGGGRYAYFLRRLLRISLWSRAGVDIADRDAIAIGAHYDFQDTLIDYILLKIPADQTVINPHRVFKLAADQDPKRLYKVDASKYRSIIDFTVEYSAPVTV